MHKTLGPWLREYCVAKQTAAVLTAHKCTLSVLKTITDDQLRAIARDFGVTLREEFLN